MKQGKSELKLGVLLTYINMFASNIISILYTPYILHTLGQSEYGVYTLVWNIVNYLTVLDLGFSTTIIRYASKYRAENKKKEEAALYGNFLIIYSILSIVSVAICVIIRDNFSGFAKGLTSSEVEIALKLIMIGSLNVAISFPFSVFRGIVNVSEKFTFIKIVDLFRTILTPITTFTLLFNGSGSIGLMWAYTCITFAVFAGYVIYSFAVLHQKICICKCEREILSEVAVYSFYIFLGMIVDKIYWGTDQIILSNKADSESIAVYSVGSSFPGYFISFSTAISGVLLPRITKISTEKDETASIKLSEMFIKVGRLQFWILSLVLLGFVFVGKEFICTWAGEEYEEGYWIALIIMVPSLISLSQNTGISILQAKNKMKFRSITYVFIAFLNIVISLILVEKYGGVGCAVGTTIGTVLGPIILMNIYYAKVIGIDIIGYWKNIVKMSITLIIPAFIGILYKSVFNISGYFSIFIFALVFSTVFGVSAYYMGFNQYEKELVKSLWRRIKK